jgi:GNAT superfamily N-acetyltransferase
MSNHRMEHSPTIAVRQVDGADAGAVAAAGALFREYAGQLGVDLSFQGFDQELAALPGDYAAPQGALLLATVDGVLAGCGAFRPRPEVDHLNACEMKRLYVRQAFRRFGLGRQLARQLMDLAVQAGYSTMLLDTLDDMEAARQLYGSLGFVEIPPYYYNPLPGSHYLKADLAGGLA